MKKVVIFGGSGFIGRSLVKLLLNNSFFVVVVCSNGAKAQNVLPQSNNLKINTLDIFNQEEVNNAVKNCDIVVNLIGKLYEVKKGDFTNFHTKFTQILSKALKDGQQIIHISALAIEQSCATSIYAQTKLDGEGVIASQCNNYTIIRPSIVFGEGDGFFGLFAKMAKFTPFLPLIGGGRALFSPIFVEDISGTILFIMQNPLACKNKILQAAGNEVATFKDLINFTLKTTNKKRFLLNIPFCIAKLQAKLLNFFRIFILTSDQVELLKYNNIKTEKYDNIDSLVKNLKSYKQIVPAYLTKI